MGSDLCVDPQQVSRWKSLQNLLCINIFSVPISSTDAQIKTLVICWIRSVVLGLCTLGIGSGLPFHNIRLGLEQYCGTVYCEFIFFLFVLLLFCCL